MEFTNQIFAILKGQHRNLCCVPSRQLTCSCLISRMQSCCMSSACNITCCILKKKVTQSIKITDIETPNQDSTDSPNQHALVMDKQSYRDKVKKAALRVATYHGSKQSSYCRILELDSLTIKLEQLANYAIFEYYDIQLTCQLNQAFNLSDIFFLLYMIGIPTHAHTFIYINIISYSIYNIALTVKRNYNLFSFQAAPTTSANIRSNQNTQNINKDQRVKITSSLNYYLK